MVISPTAAPERPLVLVVEDDPDIRETICMVLSDLGYGTLSASDLARARGHLRRASGAIVLILDLMLNGEHAEELLEELVGDPNAPLTLIVSAARDAGAIAERFGVPWLAKPFDLDALATAITSTITQQRRPSRPLG